VRAILFWGAGLALLFFLFTSVHLLNIRREAAMKAPRTSPAAAPAAAEPAEADAVEEPAPAPVKKVKPDSEVLSAPAGSEEALPPAAAEERRKPAAAEPREAPASRAAAPTRYVIQVATYANASDAEKVVGNLRGAGLAAFVKELRRPSGRVYYSVLIGGFAAFQEAQAFFERFREREIAKPFPDAFIRNAD
jgi:cell division protein FtsN